MNEQQLQIRRPSSAEDWRVVRRLCCQTGDNGAPIAQERWPFFGEQWIGPYQRLEPEWAYLAELNGAAVGYLTGCPDTRHFERRKGVLFIPSLLARIVTGRYPRNADVKRFVRRALRLEKSPDRRFPVAARWQAEREYPAHLHVNVDDVCRGLGVGRRLIDHFAGELRAESVPGMHVYCGADPAPFYRRLGFAELERVTLSSGATVYLLGLKL